MWTNVALALALVAVLGLSAVMHYDRQTFIERKVTCGMLGGVYIDKYPGICVRSSAIIDLPKPQ